ncbi:MAG: TRAP transporter large permease subunit [Candidatus Hatepunaea meridiana]|nr:TRAP transporter large permease subunit [Candidatus Hatepunaea meridiana]
MSLLILILVLFALIGLPLFLVLSGLALAGFISADLNPALYFAELLRLTNNPTLIAIPLFTFGGYLLAESNASKRLVRLANALMGNLPGGLALVALFIMALFTAFTGASGITIIAMGGLLLPALLKGGYSERFSLGLLTASGSIGLLFPPSLPLILYGVVAGTPIDKLFIAGIVPGLLLVSGMALYSVYIGSGTMKIRVDQPKEPLLPAIKSAIWEIPLPFIVVGGIYGGFFTVTEAAVVTASYLLIVECFIIRDLHPIRDLPRILTESSILIGGILLILGAALALTNFLIFTDVPTIMLSWIKSVVTSRFAFLLLLNVFLLIVGCMMDIFSALVVVVPLILPIALSYGIDPIHLGVIFLANLEIGYCTPPVGLNLFIASFRFKQPILKLYRAALPFLVIQLIILALITYLPQLSLFPVSLFEGK